MKGFPLKKFLCVLIIPCVFSSCSWISHRRGVFSSDDGPTEKTGNIEMVPKVQYDQLLAKYNELLKNAQVQEPLPEQAATSVEASSKSVAADLGQTSGMKDELVETVDIFDKGNSRPDVVVDTGPETALPADDVIENQIQKLRKAEALVLQNKFNDALGPLKELEGSSVRQIKVRAKYLIGEMLFIQKEYDLSMQIFEEIVNQYAFSGLVLKALGRLVVCSEKLKLAKKQEQYYSLLHDFFETN